MTGTETPLDVARRLGVTRLCHFTPSLNLPHIIRDGCLRTTRELSADVRACFSPTDNQRLDGHPDCICCSIEYPNTHYLVRARSSGRLAHFPDWVVLTIDPSVLNRSGALFSPRNAAANYGAHLRPGVDCFRRCYAPSVQGARGLTFTRGPQHLSPCPTDEQAEALVPGRIDLKDVKAVIVRSASQAATESARLRQLDLTFGDTPVILAPALFDRHLLSSAIRSGQRPMEERWTPASGGGDA